MLSFLLLSMKDRRFPDVRINEKNTENRFTILRKKTKFMTKFMKNQYHFLNKRQVKILKFSEWVYFHLMKR